MVSVIIAACNVTFNLFFFLLEVYGKILAAHTMPRKYVFSDQARKVYVQFSDGIVDEMNKQLQEKIIVEDSMSKDRKIFVRY